MFSQGRYKGMVSPANILQIAGRCLPLSCIIAVLAMFFGSSWAIFFFYFMHSFLREFMNILFYFTSRLFLYSAVIFNSKLDYSC